MLFRSGWVGLGDRMHVLPPVLSGGEKQRAAIARALIVRPELLLADEPTGNVDPSLARRLLRLFLELHRSGTSVVIATHDLGLMDQFDGARRLVDEAINLGQRAEAAGSHSRPPRCFPWVSSEFLVCHKDRKSTRLNSSH